MPEFWKDKSFWFAAVTVILGVAEYFGLGEYTPPTEVSAIVIIVVGVVNWLLHRNETQSAIRSTEIRMRCCK